MLNKKQIKFILGMLLANIILSIVLGLYQEQEIINSYLNSLLSSQVKYLSATTYFLHSICIMFLFMILTQDNIYKVISYKNKTYYYNIVIVKKIFFTALIYATIMFISILFTEILNVGFGFLLFFDFFKISYMFFVQNILFLSIILLIFLNMKLWINNNDFGAALMVTIVFLTFNKIISGKLFSIFSLMPIYINYYSGIEYYVSVVNVVYMIICIAILYQLGIYQNKRCDIL